jgi:hypothetical protein
MTTINDASTPGFAWTKSTYSDGGNNCVEVAHGAVPAALPVRDSKSSAGPAVVFSAAPWGAFVNALKRGDVA